MPAEPSNRYRPGKTMVYVLVLATVALAATAPPAWACGGFFYKEIPIDQTGEQIIFRQDGSTITAILSIQYEGEAEDFAWVLPVPSEPEITLASDLVFEPLESATRPQFRLDTEGSACPVRIVGLLPGDGGAGGEGEGEGDGEPTPGVAIVEELALGPFDIQVLTADDAGALADWLDENGYNLTERGGELIGAYVQTGAFFIAMKLRQDRDAGDVQPIQVVFESEMPMVPLRIAAVAALPDTDITIWILGDARAVPLNYPHVVVNYTRLNWYSGTSSAYADYQALVTEAMNEVGGLGFATDYAGTDVDLLAALPDAARFRSQLEHLALLTDNFDFYDVLVFGNALPLDNVVAILRRLVPLPEGTDEQVYLNASSLVATVGEQTLTDAQPEILTELEDTVIVPLEGTLAVFEDVPYTTRLFTTLSPEEMTRDPFFSFNPDLEGQPVERNATLRTSCVSDQTVRELILGEGTDRDDEVVIRFVDEPDYDLFLMDAHRNVEQSAVRQRATLSTSGPPQIEEENKFDTVEVGKQIVTDDGGQTRGGGGGGAAGFALCGLGLLPYLPLALAAFVLRTRQNLG